MSSPVSPHHQVNQPPVRRQRGISSPVRRARRARCRFSRAVILLAHLASRPYRSPRFARVLSPMRPYSQADWAPFA